MKFYDKQMKIGLTSTIWPIRGGFLMMPGNIHREWKLPSGILYKCPAPSGVIREALRQDYDLAKFRLGNSRVPPFSPDKIACYWFKENYKSYAGFITRMSNLWILNKGMPPTPIIQPIGIMIFTVPQERSE